LQRGQQIGAMCRSSQIVVGIGAMLPKVVSEFIPAGFEAAVATVA